MELAAIDILEFGTLNSAVRCDFSIAELQALHPPWPFYNPLPTKQFKKIFHEQNIKGDGNCLFRSVACALLGDENRYVETKQELLEWCRSNPRRTLELAKERCTFAEIEYILQTDRCWGDDVCVDIMQECFGIAIYSWIEPKRRADPYVVGLMPLPDLESPSHVIHLAFVNSNHFNLLIPFLASPTQHLSVEGDVQRDKSAKSSMMIGASMAVAGE